MKISIKYIPSHYKASLFWFKDGKFNGVAEWVKVTSQERGK